MTDEARPIWRRDGRIFVVAAVILCSVVSIGLLTLPSNKLDDDSLLPGQSSSGSTVTVLNGPAPESDGLVGMVLAALVAITALPLLAPRSAYRLVSVASTVLMGVFVLVTILRLGIIFVPVIALQVVALKRAFAATPRAARNSV